MENLLIPYQAIDSIPCTHALILAPHPDDEVFGCGGAIMRHIERGIPVQVIIVSDGAYGISEELASAYILQRQTESINAANILGYGAPVFWHYQDRAIGYGEKLIREIMTAISAASIDLVYAPSIFEMHPDHRALGMAAIEAVRRLGKGTQLALYEVGIPLHPNQLIDISNLAQRKAAAMACFVSQNAKQRYDLHIAALNCYRTYTLPALVTAAEAYILISAEELCNDPLKLYQSEHTRQNALGLALDTSDTPLVSIIIRSMDRSTLSEALDSVALQTYPNIEVIIVNAKGTDHRKMDDWCGCFPLRFIDSNKQLGRSQAANSGLEAAQGVYLIFLDDDDIFYPEHLANLVATIQSHKLIRCVYSGIRVEHYYDDGRLESIAEFNEPFDHYRLLGRNFIPIHAMLFAKSLVIDGCRFDEDLSHFEDWDFWIQLAQRTEILHIDKITACYRNQGYSGLGIKQNEDLVKQLRGKIFDKWKILLTGAQIDNVIEHRELQIINLRQQITHNKQQIIVLQNQYNQLHNQYNQLQKTVNDLVHSTSWKITAPLRFFVRVVRGQRHEALDGLRRRLIPPLKVVYWRLPTRWRKSALNIAYRTAGPLFAGKGHYEAWCARMHGATNQLAMTAGNLLAGMIDLSSISPLTKSPPGRIAIHAHIFYADLASEFAKSLRNMPYPYDLFISTPNESASHVCKQVFSDLPRLGQLTVTVVPNRGRDIAPMFCTFGEALQQYDYVAHIHSKKSLYNNGATDGWREYLLESLLGSKLQIQKIFTLLTGEKSVGLVYPQNFITLPYAANSWLSNRANGYLWCNKLGITNIPLGYFDFPAGSMFWARTDALRPLFAENIRMEDFPEEAGQVDGTLAHCLERLPVLVTRRAGLNAVILRDTQSHSWSRWRFESYLARKQENIHAMLSDPTLHCVIFDIFDTLLIRPLLNPERIKNIIARQAGTEAGSIYLELRATAEAQARQKAGHDIGLDAIFTEIALLSGLAPKIIHQLRSLEETIELETVMPRPDAIALLQFAIDAGKRIILASDMYLPKPIIEKMLRQHGIHMWHDLYVSSDNGMRKDTGDLYRHILSQENVSPEMIIVIGDNEHSDVQVPGDLGIKYLHIMRPVELARAIPRLGPLIEQSLHHDDLNRQLTLGTIVQGNFHPLFFPRFDTTDLVPATPWAVGFSVAGPLVLSFIQWLIAKASADGIQRLYFLAREGQILKMVYDHWTSNDPNAMVSDYLVLSRRAVTVPMITNFDEILQIAQIQYFSNHLFEFIYERYGIKLSTEECEGFARLGLWPRNKLVSVEQKNIDHLIPLLQALEQRILAQAQSERPGLLAYLDQLGLNAASSSAIVDVGYAATVQGYLNRLLNKTIHGYYLITNERAGEISVQHGVIAQGCFGHHVSPTVEMPLIFKESFSLEKLLSSDEAQIICYKQGDSGDINPEFRQLADEERQSMLTRKEIRRGIMDFVNQSIVIRDKLASDFTVPPDIAVALFETFIEYPSKSEQEILGSLTLDDYYCGRGLVS